MTATLNYLETVEDLTAVEAEAHLRDLRSALRNTKGKAFPREASLVSLRMAMVLRGQRRYKEAFKIVHRLCDKFAAFEDDAGLGFSLNELSIINRELQRNHLALDYASKAQKLFERAGLAVELAWVFGGFSVIHYNLFRREESLAFAKKANEIFLANKSQAGLTWNACNLTVIYAEMGLYKQAEIHCLEALAKCRQRDTKQGVAWSLLWLGMIQRSLCRFDEALKNLKRAEQFYARLGLKDRLGWCLLNVAAVNRSVGKNENAIRLNTRAMQLFGPLHNNDGVAWGLLQMGHIEADQGQLLKAWQTFREALNLHTDIANRKGMGWAHNGLGRVYLKLDDLVNARQSFSQSRTIANQIHEEPLIANSSRNMASMCLVAGAIEESNRFLLEAEELSKKLGIKEVEVEAALVRVPYLMLIGQTAEAAKLSQWVLSVTNELNFFQLRPVVTMILGEIAAMEGRVKEGVKFFEKAYEQSLKMKRLVPLTASALGLIELRAKGFVQKVPLKFFDRIERQIRTSSSRRMRAKFLLLKGLADNPKFLHQAVDVAEQAGLWVLLQSMLDVCVLFCQKRNLNVDLEAFEEKKRELFKKKQVDFNLIRPRSPAQMECMPVSLMI